MNANDKLFYALAEGYAEEALNVAVAYIQSQLGVTDGGYASHYFDDETANEIKTIFKGYMHGEIEQRIED